MGILDGCWHTLNFFGPAVGMGALAALLAKLLWWRHLRGVAWTWLAACAIFSTSVVLSGGLLLTGRDGRMVTYGAMVLACALALWWAGWSKAGRQ